MALAQAACAEQPFSFEATPGKLPKDVVPLSYEIRIRPDIDALTTQGRERIIVRVRKPVDRIVLNASRLTDACKATHWLRTSHRLQLRWLKTAM